MQIWTDVDGILAADPRVLRDPRHVPQMSYGEALDLANFGAHVLHPASVEVAGSRAVPLRVLNSQRPDAVGTLVSHCHSGTAALACLRELSVLSLTPRSGPAAPVRDAAARLLSHAALAPTIVLTADGRVLAGVTRDAAATLASGLADIAHVSIWHDAALLAAVAGEPWAPELADDLREALDGIDVHHVARFTSERAVLFVVDDADLPTAMRRAHDWSVPRLPSDAAGPALAGASQ